MVAADYAWCSKCGTTRDGATSLYELTVRAYARTAEAHIEVSGTSSTLQPEPLSLRMDQRDGSGSWFAKWHVASRPLLRVHLNLDAGTAQQRTVTSEWLRPTHHINWMAS